MTIHSSTSHTPDHDSSRPASLGLSTRAVHGTGLEDLHGAPHLPIYHPQRSGSTPPPTARRGRRPHPRRPAHPYGRNPTTFALEETMAAVEGRRRR